MTAIAGWSGGVSVVEIPLEDDFHDIVIWPGHGPLTTVGEEKRHNPFFPEFTGAQPAA